MLPLDTFDERGEKPSSIDVSFNFKIKITISRRYLYDEINRR